MPSPDGNALLSGHADGSIYRFFFEGGGSQVSTSRESAADTAQGILTRHSCAPYCLTWAQHIVAAGCDRRIVFYDDQGVLSTVNREAVSVTLFVHLSC